MKVSKCFRIELPDGSFYDLSADANKIWCIEGDSSIPNGTRRYDAIEDVVIPQREWSRFMVAMCEAIEKADWT
jgi:hypothetical protein